MAQNSFKRAPKNRPVRDRILIVCEGEKTEPNYFQVFRVKTNVVELDGKGFGNDPRRYNILNDKQKAAIKNAIRLQGIHGGTKPYDADPSTTVYKLVQELN